MDEPLVDDVPAGQTAHEAPGTRNVPAAQEYRPGAAEGAVVNADPGGDVGTTVGAAVGTTGPTILIR